VDTFLGVVGLVVFIACVIVLAAVVTATVVRISPTPNKKPEQTG
jgi:archaellin